MISACVRRKTISKLIIFLTYILLLTILFNWDKSLPKFKRFNHLTGFIGINAQTGDQEPCDDAFSVWDVEEEHGADCDDAECKGACLDMGYGEQTSYCMNEEMCCCNYDNVPTPQPLPDLEPGDLGAGPYLDLAPDPGSPDPIPCEDTPMLDQLDCDHGTCKGVCQKSGFTAAASLCYKTGQCCCNKTHPCDYAWSLTYDEGICNNPACKHTCRVIDYSFAASFCFHKDVCCCKK